MIFDFKHKQTHHYDHLMTVWVLLILQDGLYQHLKAVYVQ